MKVTKSTAFENGKGDILNSESVPVMKTSSLIFNYLCIVVIKSCDT